MLNSVIVREVQQLDGTKKMFTQLKPIDDRFKVGSCFFAPIATLELEVACAVDILFLRYEQAGQTLIQSGDIDNRLKTLFDALRLPQVGEFVDEPQSDEHPFFCLLENDSLISKVSVNTDVLLQPDRGINDVHLVLTVNLRPATMTYGNMGLGV